MSAIGIFAGRGDVLLAMALACIIGMYCGWQAHRCHAWLRRKLAP